MEIRPAGPAEADFIAAHMWQRGADEMRHIGVTTAEEARDRLRLYSSTPLSFAMFDNDEPIAFFGAIEIEPNYYRTWFQATDAFVRSIRNTVVLKRFLDGQVKKHPGATLDLMSASAHPAADKWFRLLGFRLIGEAEGHKCYRYNVAFVESQDATE